MGQRLCVNIKKGDVVLANAYYHWYAYTFSALSIGLNIVCFYKSIDEVERSKMNDVALAVKLLEATGARLTEEEYVLAFASFGYSSPFSNNINRNSGLISISQYGIEKTESWAEGIISVYLDRETIWTDVFYSGDIESFLSNYIVDVKDKNGKLYKDYSWEDFPATKFGCPYDEISFEYFPDFVSQMEEFSRDESFIAFRHDEEGELFSFIV